jgi:type III pantothenate kinase
MKFLIDIGNTRIKWATGVDGSLTESGETVHRDQPLDRVLRFLDAAPKNLAEVRIANVAGETMQGAVIDAVRGRWDVPVEIAATQAVAGKLRNGYRDFRQMGVDRWLAMLTSFERYGRAVCVVDAGTAVTIDLVDASGAHLGGVIVPGLNLMQQSLRRDTGDIQRLAGAAAEDPETKALIFGRTTEAAILGGGLAALSALIDQCLNRSAERNGDSVLVISGGDAGRIIPHLRNEFDHRPLLVLEGLADYAPD